MSNHYVGEPDNSEAGGLVTRLDDDDDQASPFAKSTAMNMPKSTAHTHLNLCEYLSTPQHFSLF